MTYKLRNNLPVRYLTLADAAALVQVSLRQVQRWVRPSPLHPSLPVYKRDGQRLVRSDELQLHVRVLALRRSKWGRHADAGVLDRMS